MMFPDETPTILDSTESLKVVSAHRREAAASPAKRRPFIRGVNIGGWLLLERFITPLMFAVTDCHLQGDLCWHPEQISAPPLDSHDHEFCDLFTCPLAVDKNTGKFPENEFSLLSMFPKPAAAKQYLTYHWENFVKKQDIADLAAAGVTHVRVPMPHWILGDIHEGEPYVDGQWVYFVRLVGWCREYNIQVWPEIHTAPGMETGMEHSAHRGASCEMWSASPQNVQRSLDVIKQVCDKIVEDDLRDVVTGFGLLNEPMSDCKEDVLKEFYNNGRKIVVDTLGAYTAIHVGDMFQPHGWNDGWWSSELEYNNTMLDSHYFQAFAAEYREYSPKKHIELVCAISDQHLQACCYEDAPKDKTPSKGMSRIVGEWSAAYDAEPVYMVDALLTEMLDKHKRGDASLRLPERDLPKDRQDFLRQFVKAQMVAYEASESPGVGVSRGWFFWTLKTESDFFAEWNFLLGFRDGWFPALPTPEESSESVFGSCNDIMLATNIGEQIVDPIPRPNTMAEKEDPDSYVVPEGVEAPIGTTSSEAVEQKSESKESEPQEAETGEIDETADDMHKEAAQAEVGSFITNVFPLICLGFFVWSIWRVFFRGVSFARGRHQYTRLDGPTQLTV
eukprot:Nitzschia sp. Nitz4//scaffold86_size83305//29277//31191//NITZ4_005254-RA/size83305-snap-gene-0.165-mRNA-1//-1//CDS//3329559226//8913//frame0